MQGDELEGCGNNGDMMMACATKQSEDKSPGYWVPHLAPGHPL